MVVGHLVFALVVVFLFVVVVFRLCDDITNWRKQTFLLSLILLLSCWFLHVPVLSFRIRY